MKTAFRIAALFAAYTAIGAGSEYGMELLTAGVDADVAPTTVAEASSPAVAPAIPSVAPEVAVAPRVVVNVRPTIVSRVQVRHSGACTFELDRELTVPLDGAEHLAIRAGAGELHVEGQADLENVVVVGRVCASHEEHVDQLDLRVERARSGALTLITEYPEQRSWSGGDNTARIDLTVLVPLGMAVDIDDSSGDISVSGVGDLRVDDSSGSIRAFLVSGSVEIDDSSGDVEVEDVSGDVFIDDGSGSLDVRGVQGSVMLRDGSGDIDVRTVAGDLRVERDGSGSVRHSGVEGRVDVPQKRRRGGR